MHTEFEVYETGDDLEFLQAVIDRSHSKGSRHLRAIWTEEKRIPVNELPSLLVGVQILALATVTARGAPRVGPVDGLFYRGRFWFGSASDSARFVHLRARPQVSAAHFRGEDLAVVVHGTAHEIDTAASEHAGFLSYCREVYPHWDTFGPGNPYAVIEPETMFTFQG